MKLFLVTLAWVVFITASAEAFSPKNLDEFWIGLYLSNQIENNNEVLTKHHDMERVMNIAARISDQAGKGTIYSISIIKAPIANAFALPGGFIFVTDKLLELKLSDGELAFLLGHEISHVQNRHFERMQKEQTKVSFLNALATIGAVVLASQNHNGDDAERLRRQGAASDRGGPPPVSSPSSASIPTHLAPILAGNIFGTLYLLHSQRDFEFEADLSGARLAMQAGYSLEDGMGMLRKLFYTNYRDSQFEEWTTHPLTLARIQALKDKSDPKWHKEPAPDIYIEQLRLEQGRDMLDIYESLPIWEKPSFLKDSSAQELRPLLLKRTKFLSENKELQLRVLSLEIRNELMPKTHNSSHLIAEYGLIEQKWKEYEALGGHPSEEILQEANKNAAESLKTHREQLQRSSPGYQKLSFLLRNFPDSEEAPSWKWTQWTLEPKAEKMLDHAQAFLDDPSTHDEAKEAILKLCQRDRQRPWVYRKGMELIEQKVDVDKLKECLEQTEDLEDLVRFQSEFPEDENLPLVLSRKQVLLDQAYRAGRLAALSQQPTKAVEHFRKLLLYDSGSEKEEEVREQIYRLNTLKKGTY